MFDDVYSLYTFRMICTGLVLFGAIHYAAMIFKFNLAEAIGKRVPYAAVIIYAMFALSALYLAFDRTTWLPFLGESVLPGSLVPIKAHSGNTHVEVHVRPGAKVAYWAAKPSSDVKAVDAAYDDYSNGGVVMADDKGVAVLTFDKGGEYVVPSGKQLMSHVHYREFGDVYGMVGPVQTAFV